MFFPDEAPQVGHGPDRDIKRAVRFCCDALRLFNDVEEFGGEGDNICRGLRVDPAEFAVCAMNAHQSIRAAEFIERCGDGALHLLRIISPRRDGDEGAEQRLAAVEEGRELR